MHNHYNYSAISYMIPYPHQL